MMNMNNMNLHYVTHDLILATSRLVKKYVEIHVLYTWKKDFVSDFDSHGYVSAVSVPCSGTGCHNSSLQNLNDMVGLGF